MRLGSYILLLLLLLYVLLYSVFKNMKYYFSERLNRIRVGLYTNSDGEVLCSRLMKCDKQHPEYPIDVTHISGTNRECDDYNIYYLNRHSVLKAIDNLVEMIEQSHPMLSVIRLVV